MFSGDLGHGGVDTAGRCVAGLSLTVVGREPTKQATGFSIWRLEDRDHEVSIRMSRTGAVARYRGVRPRAKTSMTNMRPLQHGHGRRDVESAGGTFSAAAWCGCGAATLSN